MDEQAQNAGKLLMVGSDVACAESFASALGNLCRIRSEDPPDLIIADLAVEELQALRRSLDKNAELRRPPLVLLTDSASDEIQSRDTGVMDCLSRDMNTDLLRLRIEHLLEWKRITDYTDQLESSTHKRIEQLESLIEMVAHDLKSPVIAIHGFVRMLRKRCGDMPPDPRLNEILKHLAVASRSLQNYLTDLSQLLAADGIELEFEEVSLTEAIEEVLDQQIQALEEKRITVDLDFADYRPKVLADRRRIIQVLDNLIINAMVHMGEPANPRIEVRLRDGRKFVIISVTDNGVGVPPDYHEKVFKRFFRVPGTGAKTGTGLGLSIAKTIVEMHSGRIWLESDRGKGATFCFTLPKSLSDNSGCKTARGTIDKESLSTDLDDAQSLLR
jgi:signal transduction histidine kinase